MSKFLSDFEKFGLLGQKAWDFKFGGTKIVLRKFVKKIKIPKKTPSCSRV